MGVLGKQIGKRLSKVLSAKQTPLSRNQQMVEPATEAQIVTENLGRRRKRTGHIQGGTVGVGVGALSTEAARRLMDSDSSAASSANIARDTRINPADFPTYRKGSRSAKAFRKAFFDAVKAGELKFPFEGREYNTKRTAKKLGVPMPKPQSKKPPKPLSRPPAQKAHGGMIKSKPRNGHVDYRKGGLFY